MQYDSRINMCTIPTSNCQEDYIWYNGRCHQCQDPYVMFVSGNISICQMGKTSCSDINSSNNDYGIGGIGMIEAINNSRLCMCDTSENFITADNGC